MLQQRLILFALFVTVTYATRINFFDAQADISFLRNQSTIFATHIQLWTDVTDCPQTLCSCEVQTNATDDDNTFTIIFVKEQTNVGYVNIENLQPDTLYSFNLSCIGTDEILTRLIQTDYGRPSVPQNITITIISKRLRLSWSSPLLPAGPIHNYRLTIDQNRIIYNLSNDIFSYDTTEDYVYGKEYTFFLEACNKNRQNITVCSNANDGKASISIPQITTAVTPNSSDILSYSICIFIFVLCFLSFNSIKY